MATKRTAKKAVRAAQAVIPQELQESITDEELLEAAELALPKAANLSPEEEEKRARLIAIFASAFREANAPAAIVNPKNGQVLAKRTPPPTVVELPKQIDTNIPPKDDEPPFRLFVREIVSGESSMPHYQTEKVLQWYNEAQKKWQDVPVVDFTKA